MTSSDLATLGEVGARLARIVASGRVSPSYLLEGSDPEGLHEVALAFAAALLGGQSAGRAGERIRRLVGTEQHPDLHPVRKDKATVISVESLARQLEQAHRKPVEGERQVFLIDPAEAMDPAGVALYLKALEEPPEGTVYLLLSTAPDRLPATVLSRVRRVALAPLSADDLRERLVREGADAERARRAARWSAGSLARARRIVTHELDRAVARLVAAGAGGPDAAEAADSVLQALEQAASDAAEDGTHATPAELRRQHVRELLSDVIHALAVEARDRAAEREGDLPASVDPERALALLEALGRASAATASNVTPAVVVLELVRRLRLASSGTA